MSDDDERRVAEYVWDEGQRISRHKFIFPIFVNILRVEKVYLCQGMERHKPYFDRDEPCEDCYPRYWTSLRFADGGHLHTYNNPAEYNLRELCILTIKINIKDL